MHGIVSDGLQGEPFLCYSRKINPYWVQGLGNGDSPYHEMAVNYPKGHSFTARIPHVFSLSHECENMLKKIFQNSVRSSTFWFHVIGMTHQFMARDS